jgi:hypothetical protein
VNAGIPARDRALHVVEEHHPTAMQQALDIIAAWAATGRAFSSNSLRQEFDLAQIPQPVRGTAFAYARRQRWIRPLGWETSTKRNTHAKPVTVWAGPKRGRNAA